VIVEAFFNGQEHRGTWADPKLGRITLAEWAKRWQQTTTNLRPTTRDLYAYLLRRFLLPTFGKAALSSIDLLAVRAWLTDLQVQQLSPSTIAKAYRLLSRILGAAVEAGYLLRNPCTVKGAGQERAPEMRFATVAQVAALADAIDPRYRALALAAGANTRELMERMGHTSPAVALRYQHVMAGRDQAIAAALDELVQAAANLAPERSVAPPSGTLVARTRRAKPEGPGRRAGGGR
jgi:integrase